jgi:hypothetical protein
MLPGREEYAGCTQRTGEVQQLSPALTALQEAGISVKLAPTIGIAVDNRRRNRSLESLQVGPSPQSTMDLYVHVLPEKVVARLKGLHSESQPACIKHFLAQICTVAFCSSSAGSQWPYWNGLIVPPAQC